MIMFSILMPDLSKKTEYRQFSKRNGPTFLSKFVYAVPKHTINITFPAQSFCLEHTFRLSLMLHNNLNTSYVKPKYLIATFILFFRFLIILKQPILNPGIISITHLWYKLLTYHRQLQGLYWHFPVLVCKLIFLRVSSLWLQ